MTYVAAETRYDAMPYRRTGRSGLKLPAVSLGLWHNFGSSDPLDNQRAILRRAFDLGVTHFDLANNYGPHPGAAEENFGRILARDLRPYRDEMVVSTKAGYLMWPGPYGEWGSRKYLLSSLDQSLTRMGLEYVDIFYSHRPDPDTPLEETMGALDTAVRQGKALYAGGLLGALDEVGAGSIAFSPLAQGLLTDRYLSGIPAGSRAAGASPFLTPAGITDDLLERTRALDAIARRRGQTLAQLAIAWVLRGGRVTSALVGASSVRQLEDNVAAAHHLDFDPAELAEIERYARDTSR